MDKDKVLLGERVCKFCGDRIGFMEAMFFNGEHRKHKKVDAIAKTCDCKNHYHQVCDVCQRITGNEKDLT